MKRILLRDFLLEVLRRVPYTRTVRLILDLSGAGKYEIFWDNQKEQVRYSIMDIPQGDDPECAFEDSHIWFSYAESGIEVVSINHTCPSFQKRGMVIMSAVKTRDW